MIRQSCLGKEHFNTDSEGKISSIASEEGSCFSGILEPRGSVLLFAAEEPVTTGHLIFESGCKL